MFQFFGCVFFVQNKNKNKRVFYNPNEPGEITLLGQVWLYKSIIMWILSCIFIGIPIACITFYWTFWTTRNLIAIYGCCQATLKRLPAILLWLILYCFGAVFAIIPCEILSFAPFAGCMFVVEHKRHMDTTNAQYGKMIFDFIFDNKSLYRKTIVTKRKDTYTRNKKSKTPQLQALAIKDDTDCKELQLKSNIIGNKVLLSEQEQLFRLIFINYCCIKYFGFTTDTGLIEYLKKNVENEWSNVTLTSLGENSSYIHDSINSVSDGYKFIDLKSLFKAPFVIFPRKIENKLKNTIDYGSYGECFVCWHRLVLVYVYFMLYVFFPSFVLSRLFSIFLPLIAIIYFNFDFESIQLLQWILTIFYVIFMCAWIIAAIRCYNLYRVTMQLFPGLNYWYTKRFSLVYQCVIDLI